MWLEWGTNWLTFSILQNGVWIPQPTSFAWIKIGSASLETLETYIYIFIYIVRGRFWQQPKEHKL